MATVPANPPFAKGSIIWERRAGLPVWAWAALVIVGFLIFWTWRRNRQPATAPRADTVASSATTDLASKNIFILPGPGVYTGPGCPPGGGRDEPAGSYDTYEVNEGNHLVWLVEHVKQYMPNYDESRLVADNPSASIAFANSSGYVKEGTPGAIRVWSAKQKVKIPRRV